jgi:metal-responsive CopG/Arc/MetJ family transcriptional regulator
MLVQPADPAPVTETKDDILHIRISPDLLRDIDEEAESEELDRSSFVRRVLKIYIDDKRRREARRR